MRERPAVRPRQPLAARHVLHDDIKPADQVFAQFQFHPVVVVERLAQVGALLAGEIVVGAKLLHRIVVGFVLLVSALKLARHVVDGTAHALGRGVPFLLGLLAPAFGRIPVRRIVGKRLDLLDAAGAGCSPSGNCCCSGCGLLGSRANLPPSRYRCSRSAGCSALSGFAASFAIASGGWLWPMPGLARLGTFFAASSCSSLARANALVSASRRLECDCLLLSCPSGLGGA